MTKLTETERDVWKEAYKLHEKYHDMAGEEYEWTALIRDIQAALARYDGRDKRLASAIMMAIFDWLDAEIKMARTAKSEEPVQTTMEGVIPWA